MQLVHAARSHSCTLICGICLAPFQYISINVVNGVICAHKGALLLSFIPTVHTATGPGAEHDAYTRMQMPQNAVVYCSTSCTNNTRGCSGGWAQGRVQHTLSRCMRAGADDTAAGCFVHGPCATPHRCADAERHPWPICTNSAAHAPSGAATRFVNKNRNDSDSCKNLLVGLVSGKIQPCTTVGRIIQRCHYGN
jgi:hypothetical protein